MVTTLNSQFTEQTRDAVLLFPTDHWAADPAQCQKAVASAHLTATPVTPLQPAFRSVRVSASGLEMFRMRLIIQTTRRGWFCLLVWPPMNFARKAVAS